MIARLGTSVAAIDIAFFSWTDTYGVDIVDGEDDVLILACTAVIDMCCHDEE